QQQMLGGEVLILELVRFLGGLIEQLFGAPREVNVDRALYARRPVERAPELALESGRVGAHLAHDRRRDSAFLPEQSKKHVLRLDFLLLARSCQVLGLRQSFACLARELIEPSHRASPSSCFPAVRSASRSADAS